MFVRKDKRQRKILRLFIDCRAIFGDAYLQKCVIDTGVKVGLQILVSFIGVSLALRKFPSKAATPGEFSGAFVRAVCGIRVLFVLGVCSALCRAWYAEAVYTLVSLEKRSICSGAVWFSYLLT